MDRDTGIIAITGPTACGKTRRAVELARTLGGEIVSCDSRQVYRGMDLGTGKDIEEYGDIPYHLIDICRPGEKYNLHRFIADASAAIEDIRSRGKRPILCGGTGMYVESLLSGITLPEVPENRPLRDSLRDKSLEELSRILSGFKTLHNRTDIDTAARAIRAIEIESWYADHPEEAKNADRSLAQPLDAVIIGLDISRELRRSRITERLDARLQAGMLDEVRGLLKAGVAAEDLIYYGLEYKYLTLCAIGEISEEAMRHDLEIAIHQFAKRQMTWFRGMERRGFHIHWLPFDLPTREFIDSVTAILETV